ISRQGPTELRSLTRFALASSVLAALLCTLLLRAQAPTAAPIDERRKALNAVFNEYWENLMKHQPEFASTLGDKRYNDQIADRSVKAVNEALAREDRLLMRLAAIDPAGF